MATLAVVVGLLTVLTLLNLFVLLGVIRRLRTMAAATADPMPEILPTIGARVGSFALTSTDGAAVTDADLAGGQSVVLLMSPSCTPCQDTATRLAEHRDELPDRTLILLRAEPDDPDLDSMLATLAGVGTIATFDDAAGLEDVFGSRGYPTAMRIEDGVIAAASHKYAEVLPDRQAAHA
jgi:hypothetical protein